jgi:RNA polymerase sigma-70 factor (ECF subfamily)
MDPRTDGEVIAASMTDPAAFSHVFDRHFDAIHRYLYRRVGPQVADELAAETFVQALGDRERFDGRADARPWLYGIAANLLRHHRRDERRALLAYARAGIDPIVQGGEDAIVDRADALASGRRVALALASLRDDDRDVLLLFAWADLSYEAIGAALGIPIGTVRSRLHRARRRCRELLPVFGQYEDEGTRSERGTADG